MLPPSIPRSPNAPTLNVNLVRRGSPFATSQTGVRDELPIAKSNRMNHLNPQIFGKGILSPDGYSGAAGARSGVLKNAATNIFGN